MKGGGQIAGSPPKTYQYSTSSIYLGVVWHQINWKSKGCVKKVKWNECENKNPQSADSIV